MHSIKKKKQFSKTMKNMRAQYPLLHWMAMKWLQTRTIKSSMLNAYFVLTGHCHPITCKNFDRKIINKNFPCPFVLISLGPIADISVMRLSASWCHFRQCPWDVGSAWAERAGQGEVGGCTQRVQTAWPCLGSSLEATWLALGGPFLSFLA